MTNKKPVTGEPIEIVPLATHVFRDVKIQILNQKASGSEEFPTYHYSAEGVDSSYQSVKVNFVSSTPLKMFSWIMVNAISYIPPPPKVYPKLTDFGKSKSSLPSQLIPPNESKIDEEEEEEDEEEEE